MNRRDFVVLAAAAVAFPARAQQTRMRHVGVLTHLPNPEPIWGYFREGLRDLGYVENRNIRLEYRSANGSVSRLPELAAELLRTNVELIVGIQTPSVEAASRATKHVPIVMLAAADPVAAGFVKTLSHPGGNITGVTTATAELAGKSVQIMRELVPSVKRITVLLNMADPFNKPFSEQVELSAKVLGIRLTTIRTRAEELPAAVAAIAKDRPDALVIQPSLPTTAAAFAMNERIPAAASSTLFADSGVLFSYSANAADFSRKAATYVDRILRGAKPADLPVEQPTKFDFIVSQKAARSLGITLPQSVVLRADKVIE
ncbi:MAG TPA: ABC transporter substrate-binding protein [Burkholderiales bacterium]|nr:ABC transporter substrate-binding protein [Burkholderiales bacterium]